MTILKHEPMTLDVFRQRMNTISFARFPNLTLDSGEELSVMYVDPPFTVRSSEALVASFLVSTLGVPASARREFVERWSTGSVVGWRPMTKSIAAREGDV